jgi:hypothetical protein
MHPIVVRVQVIICGVACNSTSKDQHDFWLVCSEVDKSRILTITRPHKDVWDILSNQTAEEIQTKKEDLDSFINASNTAQLQLLFDKMIVKWDWRDRILEAWDLR